RGVALDSVARAYHAVVEALIDALRLVPQRTTDAEGTRQLTALDALLRANEESALRGMALVAAAVSPQVGQDLLSTSTAQSQMFTERFVQQADADQASLVVLVDQGEAAHRLDALVAHLPDRANPDSVKAFVGSARAAPRPRCPTWPTPNWSGSPTWSRWRNSRPGWPRSRWRPATRSASWPRRSTRYRQPPRCFSNGSS